MKDSLANERVTVFDKIFQQSTTARYQNTRSDSTFQLREQNFKTEKIWTISNNQKSLSAWNQLRKILKINPKDIKRFERKTSVTNHLPKHYILQFV